MSKTARDYLAANDSYIDALKAAISDWEAAETMEDKYSLMTTIGAIGQQIHRMNKYFGMREPKGAAIHGN